MNVDFYILLFILIPLLIALCFCYYLVNYLYIPSNDIDENVIYNINDVPELEEEEKYPERVVELQIIDEDD